jgi:hypothetical protein
MYRCINIKPKSLINMTCDYNGIFTIGKIYHLEECPKENQIHDKKSIFYLYKVIADDGYSRTLPKHFVNQIFISNRRKRKKIKKNTPLLKKFIIFVKEF